MVRNSGRFPDVFFYRNTICGIEPRNESENTAVRQQIFDAMADMSWQEFESNFLESILEGLGFTDIAITQRSRDGGADAFCTYKRGLVESTAIVFC